MGIFFKGFKKEVFYTLLNFLEDKTLVPISSSNFIFLWNKPLLYLTLSKHGIKTRKFVTIADPYAIKLLWKKLRVPIILLSSGKKILIKKKDTLVDVLSLFKVGRMLVFERPIKATSVLYVFVAGERVLCMEKVGKRKRMVEVKNRIRKIAMKIKEILSSDFCSIKLIRSKSGLVVDDVSLTYCEEMLEKSEENLFALSEVIKKKVRGKGLKKVLNFLSSLVELVKK